MILLDTHIFFWWEYVPEKLPARYKTILDTTADEIAISAISSFAF
jgi:PIN domain nuclease of toxin-antitoxin system